MRLGCSVVVSCYNKASYIQATVDSALAQTYPDVEVIVVDDGSSDESVRVLEQYGDRITLIRKPNGGQASAINVGFEKTTGEVIFLLDGDDLLLPDTAAAVMQIWQPAYSKVHFRLQKISSNGELIPGKLLPPYRELPSGNLKKMIFDHGFYPSPPMSGNAFSRRYLAMILPLDPASFPLAADTPIIGLAPLFGEIGSLAEVGGYWREHDTNVSSGGLDVMKKDMSFCEAYLKIAQSQLGSSTTKPLRPRWPYYLKRRFVIAKFDRTRRGPSLSKAAREYVRCVLLWPEYDLRSRFKFFAWACVMWGLPAFVLRRIPRLAGPNLTIT